MKNLVFAPLLCGTLLQMSVGCVVVSDDGAPGFLDVQWTLTEGPNSTPFQGCAEGITAEVVAEDIDTGQQYTDLYDCSAGAGITSMLPAADYDVWVNVYNGENVTNADLIAQSGFTRISIIDGETVQIDFEFPAGASFELTWSITDDLGPDATCEDVNANGVSVLATLVGTDTATDDIFDCIDLSALTPQMLLGEYVVSVSLLDGEESLNQVSTAESVSLDYGNQIYDLGDFEFILAE